MPGTNKRANDGFTFLAKAFEATSDPIFADALRALVTYGIAGGYAERRFDELRSQLGLGPLVEQEIALQRARGERVSTQQACEHIAARHQPEFVSKNAESGDPEAGFVAAVKTVQRAHSQYKRSRPDDFGSTIVVIPIDEILTSRGLYPKSAKTVPNNREWRERIASGEFIRVR